jgi:hypothetical protein
MPRTHQQLEARSLALHRLVAEKLRREPALLEIARANLSRWRASATPNDVAYLEVWRRLVEAGVEACIAAATEDSERAAALRQASPFAGILTPAERSAFLLAWRTSDATH